MLEDRINNHYDTLSENDFYVLDYVQSNIKACQDMTINELSKKSATSRSSILRLTQKLGFSGFSEFKYSLKHERTESESELCYFEQTKQDLDMTDKLFHSIEKEPIYRTIKQARFIYGFATGWGQRNALEELKRYFLSMNVPIYLIPATTELNMVLDHLTEDDLVIFISLSGDVDYITKELKTLSVRHIPTLSITSLKNNHLQEQSAHHLYYQSTDLGYRFGAEHKSFIGLQLLIDLLYRGYLNYLGQD
ncbi:transcriptional regulator, RpiR family [Pelagirhabdus alkalitolerans]|uniref:Transcriptional regulator, RpiR family n=1 Tax=Pelagirhabdus alkalitolerans TaxID=1612202 RepID=A0A1G6KY90_9BACI|nr:MurR/RpiR family transcriptional regulator [Pelagirhabdus alkalitolerans]SDC35883.1 transcriptional regulator, RpiR family [Pelagirhabdus alkalitolerans]